MEDFTLIDSIRSIKDNIKQLTEAKTNLGDAFINLGGDYLELAKVDRLLASQLYCKNTDCSILDAYKHIKSLMGE